MLPDRVLQHWMHKLSSQVIFFSLEYLVNVVRVYNNPE